MGHEQRKKLGKGLATFLERFRGFAVYRRIELDDADKQRAEELVSSGHLTAFGDHQPEGRAYKRAPAPRGGGVN